MFQELHVPGHAKKCLKFCHGTNYQMVGHLQQFRQMSEHLQQVGQMSGHFVLKFCRTICDLSTHLQTKTWDSPEFCQQMSQVLAVQKLGQFRNVPSFASKNADVSSFARNIKYTI